MEIICKSRAAKYCCSNNMFFMRIECPSIGYSEYTKVAINCNVMYCSCNKIYLDKCNILFILVSDHLGRLMRASHELVVTQIHML